MKKEPEVAYLNKIIVYCLACKLMMAMTNCTKSYVVFRRPYATADYLTFQ